MNPVRCECCCFWSDRLAKHQHGTMFAVCLNVNSEKASTYTEEADTCAKGMEGQPIDSMTRVNA